MKPILFVLSIIILAASSCITTVQPLATPFQMTTDDRLGGTWLQNGTAFTIEPLRASSLNNEWEKKLASNENPSQNKDDEEAKKKLYVLSYKKEQRTYRMLLSLIRINENYFCNFLPVQVEDPADTESGIGEDNEFLPGYTIARITINNKSNISIQFLDGDLIKKQVLAGNMRLKHEYDPLFGTFVITASTNELQQFLGKYGNDARFFPPNNSITLIRKG